MKYTEFVYVGYSVINNGVKLTVLKAPNINNIIV
jgi:hypothetical protein